MSKRARMGELAQILLAKDERPEVAEAAAQNAAPVERDKKPRERKTRKPVFGKVAKRRIGNGAGEASAAVEMNRPYGERGDFEKITVTLPSDVRALLLDESIRRKKGRSPDWPIAAIVREAIASYLARKN